jgi:pyridoxine 5-phosphate synthase
MAILGVNIDHVATVRQARRGVLPDIVQAAKACVAGGADSITVHLREDRRHIQDHDVAALKKGLKTPINLEMAATEEMVRIARVVRPHSVCLVPEKRQELTTEGGLDAAGQITRLKDVTQRIRAKGIRVSLFIDPDINQVQAAAQAGADCVEFHTGRYAAARGTAALSAELKKIQSAAETAKFLGLVLHAGHGLDYDNVRPIAAIAGMAELNIGFSIVTRALFAGLETATREMKALIA